MQYTSRTYPVNAALVGSINRWCQQNQCEVKFVVPKDQRNSIDEQQVVVFFGPEGS